MIFYAFYIYKDMPQANSIAKGRQLWATNFYVTINSNRCVVLADQLTPEEAYFKKFNTAWKTYFDQSPDV
jgi:hypothetical protein